MTFVSDERHVTDAGGGYWDFDLVHGRRWSGEETADSVFPRSKLNATAGVFLTIKDDLANPTINIQLSDQVATQIEWLDEANGQVRVHIESNLPGDLTEIVQCHWELKVKLLSGRNISLRHGDRLFIHPSVAGDK